MTGTPPSPGRPLRVALVTGLSGGGKASILRALEDIGYEAVDNPPLTMIEEMVARSVRPLAIGVDARTRGFDAGLVLEALQRLRAVLFDRDQAELLEIEPGAPGLFIERRGFAEDGRPIEMTYSWYRGDSYDFVAELNALG